MTPTSAPSQGRPKKKNPSGDRPFDGQAILDGLQDGVCLLDHHDQVTWSNPAFARLTGKPASQALGRNLWELVFGDPQALDKLPDGRRPRRSDPTTICLPLKSRWLEVTLERLGQEEASVAFLRDVTARQKERMTLQANAEMHRGLAEAAHEGIFILSRTWKLKYINAYAARMYGSRSEAMLGKSLSGIFPGPVARRAKERIGQVFTQGEPAYFEGPLPLQDGSIWFGTWLVPFERLEGQVTSVLGMSRDITGQKRLEQELQQTTEEFNRFFDFVGDMLCIADMDGNMLRLNAAWEQTLGYSPRELMERKFLDFVHPDDLEGTQVALRQLAAQKPIINFVNRYRCKDGSYRWLEWRSAPSGRLIYGAARDVTERKQMEDEQARLLERLSNHEQVLASLASPDVASNPDLGATIRAVTARIGAATGVERVGVWRLNEDASELACIDLYQAGLDRHVSGETFQLVGFPAYVKAIHAERVIESSDPAADPRLCEFLDPYFRPAGVSAVLDAAIRISGRVAGRLVLEQVGPPRRWSPDEVTFAGELADQLAQVFLNAERRQAESALRESQAMLRTVLDTIPVRVFWKDRDSRFLGCNRPFASDAGFSDPQSVVGKDDMQMPWHELAERYQEDDRAVMETGVAKLNYEEPQIDPGGQQIWLRTSKVPLFGADGRVRSMLGTYENITDRKLTVRALRESEEKFRSIIEQASEGFVLVDEQGVIIEWNQAHEGIWGIRREEVIGRPFWEVQYEATLPERRTPERLDFYRNSLLESLRTGQSPVFNRPVESAILRPDGETRYIEQTIFPVETFRGFRVASLSRDITSRIQSEQALKRQLEELTILHAVSVAGTQADSLDGLLQQVTKSIGEALSLDHVGVHLLDPTEQFLDRHIIFGAYAGLDWKIDLDKVPRTSGIVGRVLRTGHPARIADVRREPDYFEADPDTRSELCVPISTGGRTLGLLNAESNRLDFFGIEDEQLLTTVAGSLALGIEKLRLYEAERRHRQEADTLRQAATAVSSSLELRQVLETLLISLKQVIPYDSASVMLLKADRLTLTAVQGFEHPERVLNQVFPADDELLRQSVTTQEPVILADASQDARFHRWGGTGQVRGWMGVPLIIRNSVIGYITVDNHLPGTYGEESAELMRAFAQQAAVAIENARLYEQAVQAVERRSILHEAGQEIARASLDPERVYETVHRATSQMMPAEAFVIALVDAVRQAISLVYLVDKGGRWPQTTTQTGVGLAGRIIATDAPVIVRDLQVEAVEGAIHFGEQEEVRSLLAVPVRLGGKVIGMLSAQSYQPYAYTEDDRTMLVMLAAHAAVAIENSRLYAETRQRLTEMEAVSRISTALRTAQTVDEMLPILLDETLQAIGTDSGGLDMYDPAANLIRPTANRGWFRKIGAAPIPPERGIAGAVFTSGQPILIDDFAADPRTNPEVREMIPPGWSGVCIPILTLDEAIGVMFVSLKSPAKLQPDQLHLLATISEIAGNALHRADLHHQTERQVQRLASLRAIDSAISTILDLRVTLGVLLDHIISQLKVDAVDVLLLNPNTQTLDHAASTGFRGEAIKQIRQYVGEGLAGQSVRSRGPVYIANLMQTTQDLRRQFLAGEGFVTYVGIPLIAKGQVKGVLEVYTRSRMDPDADWRSFFETLAGETAIAIENASLFEELQRTNLDLSLAYDATIEGWSRALDLRDRETEGHTQRVTEMTLKLARRIGINDNDLVHVRRGSLLHDIGKMGVPDDILHKPGQLTLTEWEIMHRHPILAYEMLSPIAYLNRALDIPYCHHENWSGTGYPRGLKGEQIPLSARIFAVVDVWDALTSDRPYRKAWTRKAAYEYIRKNSAVLFDPTVVGHFLKMISEE